MHRAQRRTKIHYAPTRWGEGCIRLAVLVRMIELNLRGKETPAA